MNAETQTIPKLDDVGRMLTGRGIIPTQQRMQIAQVLFAKMSHMSADNVLTLVNEGRGHVSKATVYNTLGLFARKGLVREVIVDPTRVFYDPNTAPHHHFYNIDTGDLIDIPASEVNIADYPKPPEGTDADSIDVVIRVRNSYN